MYTVIISFINDLHPSMIHQFWAFQSWTGSPLATAPGDLFLGGFSLGTKVGHANPPGALDGTMERFFGINVWLAV
jgi:hypothetical protein